ncbi:hypothetical protein [Nonomuraea sp. MG754425]
MLDRCGRQAEALALYERLRRRGPASRSPPSAVRPGRGSAAR